jgi:hypothetical protein
MKNLFLFFFFISSLVSSAQQDPVNKLLGDKSFIEKFGHAPLRGTDEKLRIETHLEYVETLLRNAKNNEQRTPEQQTNRQKMIALLHQYRLAGNFPTNYDLTERRPCFQDKDGNICAVGYLVQQTAGQEVVYKINSKFKYALIEEMEMPELDEWINASGLTKEECAMIQPGYSPHLVSPEFENGGVLGFKEYIADHVKFSKTDSVFASFTVDTSGKTIQIKVTGENKVLSEQVKTAISKAGFKSGYWSGYGAPPQPKIASPLGFYLVFNLPADSLSFPEEQNTSGLNLAVKSVYANIEMYFKPDTLAPGYAQFILASDGNTIVSDAFSLQSDYKGKYYGRLNVTHPKEDKFTLWIYCQDYQPVVFREIPFTAQNLEIPLKWTGRGPSQYQYFDKVGRIAVRTSKK